MDFKVCYLATHPLAWLPWADLLDFLRPTYKTLSIKRIDYLEVIVKLFLKKVSLIWQCAENT